MRAKCVSLLFLAVFISQCANAVSFEKNGNLYKLYLSHADVVNMPSEAEKVGPWLGTAGVTVPPSVLAAFAIAYSTIVAVDQAGGNQGVDFIGTIIPQFGTVVPAGHDVYSTFVKGVRNVQAPINKIIDREFSKLKSYFSPSVTNSRNVARGGTGLSELKDERAKARCSFYFVSASGGEVGLKFYTGFLTAEGGGNDRMIANRDSLGDWEKFTMIKNSDGTISLKATNGKLVKLENESYGFLGCSGSPGDPLTRIRLHELAAGRFAMQFPHGRRSGRFVYVYPGKGK